MTRQKEVGYDIVNVPWHNLEGFEELWRKADFGTKEYIVNECGRIAFKTQRELLVDFVKNWYKDNPMVDKSKQSERIDSFMKSYSK